MPRLSRSISIVGLLLIAGALALDHASLHAQAPAAKAPLPFGALEWRSLGPARGGRSIAVAGSAARPNEYYFGATGGGLWKSTNGGVTWSNVTDGQLTSASVGAVAVAPSNPDIVYIGMGESELRGNIAQGDGVYKSTDAGKTWTHVGFEDSQTIAKIRDPSDQPGHRLRGRVRPPGGTERGPRDLPDQGRRQDVGEGALPRRQDGRHRGELRPEQPAGPVCVVVGGLPRLEHDVERRAGQRPVQVDRRRRPLDRAVAQPGDAEGRARQDRRQRLAGRFATGSTRRWKPRTAARSGPTTPARRGRA